MNATEAAEAMAEEAHAQELAERGPQRQERVLYSHRGDMHRWELVLDYTPAGHRYPGGEPTGVDAMILRDREWIGTERKTERLVREQTVIMVRDDLLKLCRVAKITPDELKAVIRGW